jgi:branched-subunit amino acid transport protein
METQIFGLIISMGLLTYLVRLVPFLVIKRIRPRRIVEDWITYVGEGILVSLLFPYLLLGGKDFDVSVGNVKILSGVFCVVIALKTNSVILTIVGGIVSVIIASRILG